MSRLRAAQSTAKRRSVNPNSLEDAILKTVAYADVFDYPLTSAEVHRYLVGMAASPEQVRVQLHSSRRLRRHLTQRGSYYLLDGRPDIVDTRRYRERVSATLWPQALHYGCVLACLPFVRMVAVTGALAVDNVGDRTDIDYLIVTTTGRLWLCRALVIAVVRFAGRRDVWLCPNYFLAQNRLTFEEQSLYTAHEVVQMVPIAGAETYKQMRRRNVWTTQFLPNAAGPPRQLHSGTHNDALRAAGRLTEVVLRTPIGGRLEQWEMERKVHKFTQQSNGGSETDFCADRCKGHFDGHGRRTLDAFGERLTQLAD